MLPASVPPGGDWTMFATLTTKRRVPKDHFKRLLREFLRPLAIAEHEHVLYAAVVGRDSNHRVHGHLLLRTTSATVREVEQLWHDTHADTGHAKVRLYDAAKGAVYYIADHDGELEVNIACPRPNKCRRKRGCVLAPSPWR